MAETTEKKRYITQYKPICNITPQPERVIELQEGHIRAQNEDHAKLILSFTLAALVDSKDIDEVVGDIDSWSLEELGQVESTTLACGVGGSKRATAGWVKEKIL